MAAAKIGRPNWAKGRTAATDARVARNAEIRRGKKRGPYQTRIGSERKALLATLDPSEKPACLPDSALADYSYLLGLYLGDGCIVERQNRLEITLDARYPAIIESASRAVASLHPRHRVAVRKHGNARVVAAYAWQWRLLFPQHGPGRKHTRKIELTGWQQEIVTRHPVEFLRGCLESDGSRNRRLVNGKNYPFYEFTNQSTDIRQIFEEVCIQCAVHFTRPVSNKVAITRRADVAKIDEWFAYPGESISARSFKGSNSSVC